MKTLIYFFITLLSVCTVMQSNAQCAMCKSSVESDLENGGGSIATGLNTGILYLMAIPYLLLMLGAYFFFKKPIDAKLKAWRNKHFPAKG